MEDLVKFLAFLKKYGPYIDVLLGTGDTKTTINVLEHIREGVLRDGKKADKGEKDVKDGST